MKSITLNSDTILQMKLFRDITNISCGDCFSIERTVIFVTKKGDTAKAIGSGGKNIKILRSKLNKNIKVIEESHDCCSLVKNFIFPLKVKECNQVEDKIEVEFNHSRERRFLLDNQQRGLKELKAAVSRYYPDIKDIRIL